MPSSATARVGAAWSAGRGPSEGGSWSGSGGNVRVGSSPCARPPSQCHEGCGVHSRKGMGPVRVQKLTKACESVTRGE
eukprot:8984889-Pyramimonas_sp.AAC.1